MKTNCYLIRWFKGCNFNVECAANTIKQSFKWRKEKKLFNISNENFGVLPHEFPYKFDGFDRQNHLISQILYGKWDIRKYILKGKRYLLLRYFIQMFENAEWEVYQKFLSHKNHSDSDICQMLTLIDLNEYSLKKHACSGCVGHTLEIVRSLDLNYPYLMTSMTVINAPRIFGPLLSIVKSTMLGPMAKIVEVYGHNREEWIPQILKNIDQHQLPYTFGGNKDL